MDLVEIQIQDYGGNWRTVSNVVNNLQRIGFELRSVQSRYPDRRVRAVGKDGRLIDLLWMFHADAIGPDALTSKGAGGELYNPL